LVAPPLGRLPPRDQKTGRRDGLVSG
jgi:hypothetical protein